MKLITRQRTYDSFYGEYCGETIEIERDKETDDFYIRVFSDAGAGYDGYWPGSEHRTIDEALIEAMDGAQLQKPYSHMNNRGVVYYLHKTDVVLRGGKRQTIYFFRKHLGELSHFGNEKHYEPAMLPDDRIIKENSRNGFLCVVKKDRI